MDIFFEKIAHNVLCHIQKIAEFDRLPCSVEYDKALDYVISCLPNQNCLINRIQFPADQEYSGWSLPNKLSHWKDGRADPNIYFDNSGNMSLLEVVIEGDQSEEIFFVTHLCHPRPSANDNASGPAMFIEHINYYAKNKPPLSLRFLLTIEYWGTIAYFSEVQTRKTICAGISLDMVGGDQERSGSTIIIDEIPHHLTSNIDLILFDNLQKKSKKGRYRMITEPISFARVQSVFYSGGSDHYILNDSSIGIPATCLNTYPDRYYHTDEDTPEKISPQTLQIFIETLIASIPEFALSLRNESSEIISLCSKSIIHKGIDYLSQDCHDIEKSSFVINHLLHHLGRRLSVPIDSILISSVENLFNTSYFTKAKKNLIQVDIDRRPKYIKKYKGPLYRNKFLKLISEMQRKKIIEMISFEPLLFMKAELALNYFTLGYNCQQASWLIDWHYSGENFQQYLEHFLNILLENKMIEAC